MRALGLESHCQHSRATSLLTLQLLGLLGSLQRLCSPVSLHPVSLHTRLCTPIPLYTLSLCTSCLSVHPSWYVRLSVHPSSLHTRLCTPVPLYTPHAFWATPPNGSLSLCHSQKSMSSTRRQSSLIINRLKSIRIVLKHD